MSLPNTSSGVDKAAAKVRFGRAKTVADFGNFDYAIEMYLQGLALDPDNVAGHEALRALSLRRTAAGGKDMGLLEKLRLRKAADNTQAMLNAEKLLAYHPADVDRMIALLQSAQRAGMTETSSWIEAILKRATKT